MFHLYNRSLKLCPYDSSSSKTTKATKPATIPPHHALPRWTYRGGMVSILKANSPILLTKFADFGEQIRRFWFHNPYLCRCQPLPLSLPTLTFAAANPCFCRSQPLPLSLPTLTFAAANPCFCRSQPLPLSLPTLTFAAANPYHCRCRYKEKGLLHIVMQQSFCKNINRLGWLVGTCRGFAAMTFQCFN